jgi:hypothetical protein
MTNYRLKLNNQPNFHDWLLCCRQIWLIIEFQVLAAVVMRNSILGILNSYISSELNGSFGGTCRLYLKNRRIRLARNKHEAATFVSSMWFAICLLYVSRWFLAWLILRPWRWRWHVHPKLPLIFIRLHGVISQKTELFIYIYIYILNLYSNIYIN